MAHRDTALQALDNAHAVDVSDGSAAYYAQRGIGYALLALGDQLGELIELLRPLVTPDDAPSSTLDEHAATAMRIAADGRPPQRGHFETLPDTHEPHCNADCFASDHLIGADRVHAHTLAQARYCEACRHGRAPVDTEGAQP